MGKRSEFERLPNDYYPTPEAAIRHLKPFLPKRFTFCEPCAGDGRLTRFLQKIGGELTAQYDIEPQAPHVDQADARHMLSRHTYGAEYIITNPPWSRDLLHPLIMRFSRIAPTWLLFDAGWAFSDQAAMFMDWRRGNCRVRSIVAVGRLQWIEDSEDTGKDDAAWYLIGGPSSEPPRFYPRQPAP